MKHRRPGSPAFSGLILPRSAAIIALHVVLEGAGEIIMPGAEPVRFGPDGLLVFPDGDR
jgi:hypothetical protein